MRHRLARLKFLALALRGALVTPAAAQTSSTIAGAQAILHPDPLRAPVLVVPQADSGSLVIAIGAATRCSASRVCGYWTCRTTPGPRAVPDSAG